MREYEFFFDDCEGVKYLINHERNGLLISRENEHVSMANAIVRLIEAPELRSALGLVGVKTAALHTVEECVDKLESVLMAQHYRLVLAYSKQEYRRKLVLARLLLQRISKAELELLLHVFIKGSLEKE